MSECNQCGKPAVQEYNGNPLCVSCLSKIAGIMHKEEEIRQRELIILMQQEQAIEADMNEIVGLPRPAPKYNFEHLRPPSQNTYHSITVNDSVVGNINTGEVHTIEVSMSHIAEKGNVELADTLKSLTESVISSNELAVETKNEILENISFVAQQVGLPEGQRKKGLMKSVLRGIQSSIAQTADLVTIWKAIEPLLRQVGL